jgi:hypothetical protein
MREKPSSKAREQGYAVTHKLFDFLKKLIGYSPWHEDEEDDDLLQIDHQGWKRWVIKFTPPDKRGGPSEHKPKRRTKKKTGRDSEVGT